MDRTFNLSITISRRSARLIGVGLLTLALALPGSVVASHLFSDVPNSHTFHQAISNVSARGLTAGCGGTKYCPNDFVTRGQMAAFLDRIFRSEGTALGYASIEANGTVATGYARNLQSVSVTHTLTGYYRVSFGGLSIDEDQVIVVQPRETFGNELCRVFQGAAPITTVEVFCHTATTGSPAIDIPFNVVVFN
jgi:hypothetical protein